MAPSLGCEICILPPFLPHDVQAADSKLKLACELHDQGAYDEAIKLLEEARHMFVQVYLTVAVLDTDMAAVAPLLLSCGTAAQCRVSD